jgi:SsrA-binding protein
MKKKDKKENPVKAENRKARHEYQILENFEAGMQLKGVEVKSIRAAQLSLKEGYCSIDRGEVFLQGVYIAPYEHASTHDTLDTVRPIRLLLHKHEIAKLEKKVKLDRLTLVPLKVYFKQGKAKVDIALAKGKNLYDKRETKKKKDIQRAMDRDTRF